MSCWHISPSRLPADMETVSFEFAEDEGAAFAPTSPFYITNGSTPLSIIYRVLAGTCTVKSRVSGKSVRLTTNFFKSDFQENETRNFSFLDKFEEEIKLEDYENHVKKNRYVNLKFYHAFLSEIAGCIFNESVGRHTVAFVHLYRAYEHISYAFPMIYASRTTDYLGTFENLRDWLNDKGNGAMGELKFLKKFIATVYKDEPLLKSNIEINLKVGDEEGENEFAESQRMIFGALTKKVLGWHTPAEYSPGTVPPSKLSISFENYHGFFINLRNRFFHYFNQRKDNLGIDDVVDPDLLFSMVNKASLYYLAMLFHEISKPNEIVNVVEP